MRSWAGISWERLGLGVLRQALKITLTNYTVSDPKNSTVSNKKIVTYVVNTSFDLYKVIIREV